MVKVYDDGSIPDFRPIVLQKEESSSPFIEEQSIDVVVNALENKGLAFLRRQEKVQLSDMYAIVKKFCLGDRRDAMYLVGSSVGLSLMDGAFYSELLSSYEVSFYGAAKALVFFGAISAALVLFGVAVGSGLSMCFDVFEKSKESLEFRNKKSRKEKKQQCVEDQSYDLMYPSLSQKIMQEGPSCFKSPFYEGVSVDHKNALLIDYMRHHLAQHNVSEVRSASHYLRGSRQLTKRVLGKFIHPYIAACPEEKLESYLCFETYWTKKDKARLLSYCEKTGNIALADEAFDHRSETSHLLRVEKMYTSLGGEGRAQNIRWILDNRVEKKREKKRKQKRW